jgi:hypothetical protein
VDQPNVFLNRRRDGKNRLVVVRDDRLVTALNRVWGDPESRRDLPKSPSTTTRALRATGTVLKTAGKLTLRAQLANVEYALLQAPTRDVRESFNEALRRGSLKSIGEGAWIAAQNHVFNSKDLFRYVYASPDNKSRVDADIRARAKKDPTNKSLGYFVEMLDNGSVFEFSDEIGSRSVEDPDLSRVRSAMSALYDGADYMLSRVEGIQTYSDITARMLPYAAARENGDSPEVAAAVARNVLNFVQQSGASGDTMDAFNLMFPFFKTGVASVAKVPRVIWKNDRAPTTTRVLEDGSVVPFVNRAEVLGSIQYRPIMVNAVATAIRTSLVIAAADALYGEDDEEGAAARRAGETPPGAAGLGPHQLLSSIPYLMSYDKETGRIDATDVGNAFGVAPLAGVLASAAVMLKSGYYSQKEVAEGVVSQMTRTLSPVGDLGLDQLFEGDHTGFLREAAKLLFPIALEPAAEVLTNQDGLGNPIFKESDDSRDSIFPDKDSTTGGRRVERGVPAIYREMFGDRNASTNRHLMEGYLGGLFTTMEEIGTAVMNQLGNSGLSTELQKTQLATIPGRTTITNASYADRQFGKLSDRLYSPTASHVADLKERDGTSRDFKEVGKLEREWRRNNPDAYNAFRRMNEFYRRNKKMEREIMDLQDAYSNPVRMDELVVRRKQLKVELISDLAESYPDFILPILD